MYKLSDFNRREPSDDWRVLYIWGPSGYCKTQYAVTLFENPLIVSTFDWLGKFKPDFHDGIVFDDVCCKDIPRSTMIHLLDWDMDRTIRIRYKDAFIPKNTKKVFTSNMPVHLNFPLQEEGQAILRRITRRIQCLSSLKKDTPAHFQEQNEHGTTTTTPPPEDEELSNFVNNLEDIELLDLDLGNLFD